MPATLIQKHFAAELKGVDADNHRVVSLVSTASTDRDQEIILPTAWALDNFRKSPVFLYGHAHRSQDPSNVLGRVAAVEVQAAGLVATFEYDVDINPKAKMVFEQVRKGTIRGFSVGFIPQAWVTERSPQADVDALPDFARKALKAGEAFVVYTRCELIEISQVPIPSNPDALVGAALKSARLQELSNLEEVLPDMSDKTPSDLLVAHAANQKDPAAYLNGLCSADRNLVLAAVHNVKVRSEAGEVLAGLASLEPAALAQTLNNLPAAQRRFVMDCCASLS